MKWVLMFDIPELRITDNARRFNCSLTLQPLQVPTLAIIYMNELDELLLEKSHGTILLKRFIDDIFAALVSQDMDADKLLDISNGLNDAIKFTIEKPNRDQLPFLDTLVSFDGVQINLVLNFTSSRFIVKL